MTTSQFFTEANNSLMQMREYLTGALQESSAQITPLPPSETGGSSLSGKGADGGVVGTGTSSPPYAVPSVNTNNVKDTYNFYMASIVNGVMDAHKEAGEKGAESLVFSTIHELEKTGLLPEFPGESAAGDVYMAAFLGAAKTCGLHYVVMVKAEEKWGKEPTSATGAKKT